MAAEVIGTKTLIVFGQRTRWRTLRLNGSPVAVAWSDQGPPRLYFVSPTTVVRQHHSAQPG